MHRQDIMQRTEIKLKIADTVIKMQSRFKLLQLTNEEEKSQFCERYNNFIYIGRIKPHILINVKIVEELPQFKNTTTVFVTRHPEDKKETWRLFKMGGGYIYKCPLKGKEQLMFVNRDLNRVTAYLLPKRDKGYTWDITEIIYDFLQVLLITYLAQRKSGIFVHAVAVKDLDGKGFLFAGKSGAGKTTTARIWYKNSKATVLNDDRIIIRKRKGQFFIYGSPWHGAFSDYLASRIESADLSKFFFIYHSIKNRASLISPQEAFRFLYPTLFSTFWDKICLENIISFCENLVKSVRCFHLGFKKDKSIIEFIRKIR